MVEALRMSTTTRIFIILIINLVLHPLLCLSSVIMCPGVCSCFLDSKGRKVVSCTRGGMGTIPFREMELQTEVIKITAPEYNLNTLAMDPTIQDFQYLEELHITRSNIPELGVHLFWMLRKLTVLNLSQNNITQPLDESFRGLDNLQELYLDDNRIYSLHSGTFRYLVSLKILSLQRNRIQEMMPRMFERLGKLQVLKLSGNYLRELNPESFKGVLQDLRVLECQGCSLEKINTQVYGYLPHLMHLDLGYNAFESLSSDDFCNLTSLVYLGLDGNKISALYDEVFVHAHGLKKINLSNNRIYRISPAAFWNLPEIVELDLSYNKLEQLDRTFLEPIAPSLQKLSLSGNYVSRSVLRNFLRGCSGLRNLQLADAGLTDISVDLFPEKLSVLNLSGNSLSFLTPAAVPMTLLELDISGNRFRGLSDGFLKHAEFMRLNLDNNPWSCDLCHIVPMLERANLSMTIREVTCQTPYIFEGQKLGNLKMHDLHWCASPTFPDGANYLLTGTDDRAGVIAATASVLLLVLILLTILGAFCYSRRHAAKYYTHEDKRTAESEAIFENQSALFGDERELSFKFPMDMSEKKISIATIDEEFKKESITNGT